MNAFTTIQRTLVQQTLTQLPSEVASALWRGDQLQAGHVNVSAPVCPTGFAALDAELPGGGWPTRVVTEILQPHDSWLEWRLLLPALQRCVAHHQIRRGRPLILLGPPWPPHLPGLVQAGLDARDVVWVRSQGPRLLWAAEQVIKAEGAGAVLAWLPQARPDHLRRLQTMAQACSAPVFVLRPASAQAESSAAPLRVLLSLAGEGPAALQVQVFKRRGPVHAVPLLLTVWPLGLAELVRPVAMPHAAAAGAPLTSSGVAPRADEPARRSAVKVGRGDAVAVADSMLG